jgi:26S proteasome non-ATPase regulatory subunit 10
MAFEAVEANDLVALEANLSDVKLRDEDGRTLLHVSAANGHAALVRRLLEAGAEVSTKDDGGFTPLLSSSSAGAMPIVAMLLEAKADVNASADGGLTALLAASGKGHIDVVNALLAAGAKLDARDRQGLPSIARAVASGRLEVCKLLIEKKAHVDSRDRGTGENLLHIAVNSQHPEIVEFLASHAPELASEEDTEGRTPLQMADPRMRETLKSLIGADE